MDYCESVRALGIKVSTLFLSTMSSKAPNLCSPLNVTRQVSHRYETGRVMILCIFRQSYGSVYLQAELRFCVSSGRVMILFIFISVCLDSKRRNKRLHRVAASVPDFSLLSVSLCMQFWFVSVIPKYLKFVTFLYCKFFLHFADETWTYMWQKWNNGTSCYFRYR
jgi:hypothetical protein